MNKIIQIVINGVPKQVEKRDYTFQEVISLAFGSYFPENQSYTITTTRKNDDQSKQKLQIEIKKAQEERKTEVHLSH